MPYLTSLEGRMNPEVKDEFVRRLLWFNGRTSKGYLKRTDGCMCVMGVLADMAVEEGIIPEPLIVEPDGRLTGSNLVPLDVQVYGYRNHVDDQPWKTYTKMLPPVAADWANIGLLGGYAGYGGRSLFLTDHSDEGVPFRVIAEIVQHHL